MRARPAPLQPLPLLLPVEPQRPVAPRLAELPRSNPKLGNLVGYSLMRSFTVPPPGIIGSTCSW